MGRPDKASSALAKKDPSEIEMAGASTLASIDPLEGFLGIDDVETGLSDVEQRDKRLAALVLNMKGVDGAGDPIAANMIFNTVDETISRDAEVIWLDMKKTRLYSYFDTAQDKTVRVCRSFDRENGTMEDGTQRPCKGCPEQEWKTENGKRSRNCADVWNMFGIDAETQMPLVMRYKKTAEPVLRDYLNKHHINKRTVLVNGMKKVVDMPLCAFTSKVSGVMDATKKYALPVLQRGTMLEGAQIKMLAEQAKKLRKSMERDLLEIETVAEAAEGGSAEGDASFDTTKFAGNGPNDFIETQGESSGNAAA